MFLANAEDRGGFCSHPSARKFMTTIGAISMNMLSLSISKAANCKCTKDFSILDNLNHPKKLKIMLRDTNLSLTAPHKVCKISWSV
jgi:hypothetical protein